MDDKHFDRLMRERLEAFQDQSPVEAAGLEEVLSRVDQINPGAKWWQNLWKGAGGIGGLAITGALVWNLMGPAGQKKPVDQIEPMAIEVPQPDLNINFDTPLAEQVVVDSQSGFRILPPLQAIDHFAYIPAAKIHTFDLPQLPRALDYEIENMAPAPQILILNGSGPAAIPPEMWVRQQMHRSIRIMQKPAPLPPEPNQDWVDPFTNPDDLPRTLPSGAKPPIRRRPAGGRPTGRSGGKR